MRTLKIIFVTSIFLLASIACSLDFNIPITTDIKTGETVTESINIPSLVDDGTPVSLHLNFGAGEMNLFPGEGDFLVNGEAIYNVTDFKPKITQGEHLVKIETGSLEINGIPNFNKKVKNTWNLTLGSSPTDLTIKAGAYVGNFELGGTSLSDLYISDGASQVDINFQQPNEIQMGTFRYETGASNISLENLANANFDTMIFQSGAGDYKLDFSGQLQRDATIFIETGLSSLRILVPKSTHVELEVEGGLTNITTRGDWVHSGTHYSIPGSGAVLKITLEMNAGNLILDHP